MAVHGVIARPVRALQVRLPGLVRGPDQIADIPGPDRVLRIFLERVIQRYAERAAARQREVVRVAWMLLGEEVSEQARAREQAVEERSLPGIADDGVIVLVLEVKQENMLVTRCVRGWRG